MINKIGYNESFWLYVYVDWKICKKVARTLRSAGFIVKKQGRQTEENDDVLISVLVSPGSSSTAYQIIKSIIQ